MILYYSGVQCELREVQLRHKPQAMLDVSKKGTVPVLQIDERVIDESLEVMHWALQKSDPENWLAVGPSHYLVNMNDNYFKYYLDRYKYSTRYPQQSQKHYFDRAMIFLMRLEESLHLAEGQTAAFLDGEISWIDVAIFPFVRQFAHVDMTAFTAQAPSKLRHWLAYFEKSDLFLNVMHKCPVWHEGDPRAYFFPEGPPAYKRF